MEEIWKVVEGFSRYEVSNKARVRNLATGDEVSQVKSGIPQYLYVNMINDNDERKLVRVHRTVAGAFCENSDPDEYTVVDHIDRDKFNNLPENLRWTNAAGNSRNADNNVYFGDVLLKDFASRYDNQVAAYSYLYARHSRGVPIEEAVVSYEEYLVYGWMTRKVEWEGKEVYLLDLVNFDREMYSKVAIKLSEGVPLWNAIYSCPPIDAYKNSVVFSSRLGVNIWCKSKVAATEAFGVSLSTIDRAVTEGWSIDLILSYDPIDAFRQTVLGFNGTLKEIAEHFGITESMLLTRISRQGLSLEKAVTLPKQRIKYVTYKGQRMSLKEFLAIHGIDSKRFQHVKQRKQLDTFECLDYHNIDITGVEF